jgi:lysyl-tRNA synthetase class 2
MKGKSELSEKNSSENTPESEREQRIKKLENLRRLGVEPYPYRFERTHKVASILENEDEIQLSKKMVTLAGRVMALRGHGHTVFGDIQDDSGKIQFYVRDDTVSSEDIEVFANVDVGDFLGLEGSIFRTHSGELTLRVGKLKILAKSLLPLPEKFHGLRDKELRYRQRYIDLIINEEVRDVFVSRSKIVETIRQFLLEKSFIEVETPILQSIYGGAMARPFVTHHNALDMDLYLRIADELYLKRLVVGGVERVFEFSKDFRNEGMDKSHNPEFTMLECYAAYHDYNDMMNLTEEIFVRLKDEVVKEKVINYGEYSINLEIPWKRISYFDALREATGEDLVDVGANKLRDLCHRHGLETGGVDAKGAFLDVLFSGLVEPTLIQPTFITDYPVEVSPLAKVHREKEGVVERFELFVAGLELANAFSELNDPLDQLKRFEEQAKVREKGGEESHPFDEDYINALEQGMPPTGGLGIGIDRLVMLLTNSSSIRDVIFFPHMRPEKGRSRG